MGRYKAQHQETAASMQADERAHELEEAVKHAPSAAKRRSSVTASSEFSKTLSAGEALARIGSGEHGDVSLDGFAQRARRRSCCFLCVSSFLVFVHHLSHLFLFILYLLVVVVSIITMLRCTPNTGSIP